jgi:hypothetical protein
VAKPDILARVDSDLAVGHTHIATQRLRTLLATDPDDLSVRELLAAVYRQTGNRVEAGRWSFLTDEVHPVELAAFARANPSPWLRLRLLAWAGDPQTLPSSARERLTALIAEAEQAGPPPRFRQLHREQTGGRSSLLPCLFVLLTIGAVLALAAIGVVRISRWILA